MEKNRLEPCPFCGRDDTIGVESYKDSGKDWFYVTDYECMAQGPISDTADGAIYLWNYRSSVRF